MNFRILAILLLVVLLAVDHGDSWGRRRRRGKRRRGGWFRKIVRGAGRLIRRGIKLYNKYKGPVGHIINGVRGIFGDRASMENLATLKNEDLESYADFMDNLKETLDEHYPEQDNVQLMEMINDAADMKEDELNEFIQEMKSDMQDFEADPLVNQIKDELEMRVANIA